MVMDVDERVSADLATTYAVPHTTDSAALLANPEVDAAAYRSGREGRPIELPLVPAGARRNM